MQQVVGIKSELLSHIGGRMSRPRRSLATKTYADASSSDAGETESAFSSEDSADESETSTHLVRSTSLDHGPPLMGSQEDMDASGLDHFEYHPPTSSDIARTERAIETKTARLAGLRAEYHEMTHRLQDAEA
jgi:hypothetical protein